MHPILFELGGFPVYTYGVLLAAAYLLGLQFALVRARARGLDANRVMDLGIWVIVSALVGAKLLLVVVEWRRFSSGTGGLLNVHRSGGVFYGGLVTAVVFSLLYLRKHKMPIWTVTDVFAPAIALGHVIGRMGCFFAGCCFGRPTTVPWAITFHSDFAAQNVGTPTGVPLHPTQLYEAGAELIILGVLLGLERRSGRSFAGKTFWTYLLLYGISRFVIEFYRGDPRGTVAFLSTSQFVSLLIVPLAAVMLLVVARRGGPEPIAARQARVA
jgi:phosphatidylglycerol:prolipoprotein diacylglycerol transferase